MLYGTAADNATTNYGVAAYFAVAYGRPMKVRELIHALQMHDQDMDVVIPGELAENGDFIRASIVAADVFAPSRLLVGSLELAELRDQGAFTAVRLCGGRR